MSVDVASKPTLASYDIRPDAFDPHRKRPNALQTAKDPDDAKLGPDLNGMGMGENIKF